MKKLLSLTLAVVLLLALLPVNPATADPPAPGAGSVPISNLTELNAIRNNLNRSYHLVNDIDLGAPSLTGSPMLDWDEWTPIGDANNPFTGTFDGQGYIIRGMTITKGFSHAGLFGHTSSNAVIKYLGMTDVHISIPVGTDGYAGAMVGFNNGNISDCYAVGNIYTPANTATDGIVGANATATLTEFIRNSHWRINNVPRTSHPTSDWDFVRIWRLPALSNVSYDINITTKIPTNTSTILQGFDLTDDQLASIKSQVRPPQNQDVPTNSALFQHPTTTVFTVEDRNGVNRSFYFMGWAFNPTGAIVAPPITINSNIVLYAIWRELSADPNLSPPLPPLAAFPVHQRTPNNSFVPLDRVVPPAHWLRAVVGDPRTFDVIPGVVLPNNATNQLMVFSIPDRGAGPFVDLTVGGAAREASGPGLTGATVAGNVFYATAPGFVDVYVAVPNAYGPGVHFWGIFPVEIVMPGLYPPNENTAPNVLSASPWAQGHINAAYGKGFIPAQLQGLYTQNITRGEFAYIAMAWLRYKLDLSSDDALLTRYNVARGTDPTTADPVHLAAKALGVVAGFPDFWPDMLITRAMAATMVSNMHHLLDPTHGNVIANIEFPDYFVDIELPDFEWAWRHIAFVSGRTGYEPPDGYDLGKVGIRVMNGVSADRFAPRANFTREQSIIVFNQLIK